MNIDLGRLIRWISTLVLAIFFGLTSRNSVADSPLPEDPELATWTLMVERVFKETRELNSLQATHINAPGSSGPTAEHLRSLWKKVADTLPAGDLLRKRSASAAAKLMENLDVLAAAEMAAETNHPMWASQLYEKAGKPKRAKLLQERAIQADLDLKRLQKKYKGKIVDGQFRDFERPPSSPTQWLKFLTTGPDDPWLRQCDGGFEHFARGLPNNARLRRALLLYYIPCVSCGLSPIEGPIDVTEPMLRLTAKVEPDNLARIFSEEPEQHRGFSEVNLFRITGDSGMTGNVLRLPE